MSQKPALHAGDLGLTGASCWVDAACPVQTLLVLEFVRTPAAGSGQEPQRKERIHRVWFLDGITAMAGGTRHRFFL